MVDGQQSKIDSIEDIAYENHNDVVMELQENGNDTPRLRLVKTKQQDIDALADEHSRWGAHVFDDKSPESLGIVADNVINLVDANISGFNPFYQKPKDEVSPDTEG